MDEWKSSTSFCDEIDISNSPFTWSVQGKIPQNMKQDSKAY